MVILAVDDHPLIRSALRETLRGVAERVELLEAPNPEEGLALLRARPDIDLVFLDLNFSEHTGVEFVGSFRAAAPAVPLMVYTMHEDVGTLRQVLSYKVAGIVPKTHSTKLLQKAVELVMEGGVYLPPNLARLLADKTDGAPDIPQAAPAGVRLSALQWKILELLAQGCPNKEIAKKLGIASNTVKNQLTMVFQKLAVSNRTQAAVAARALLRARAEAPDPSTR